MCPFSSTLVLLAVIVGLVYIFLIWNFDYWKKRGIKSARKYPFVGSYISQFTQKRNVVYDLHDAYNKYKKTESIIGVFNCRSPQLMVLTPEYAHRVFVNDFRSFHDNEFALSVSGADKILGNNPFVLRGEEWKERRAEITPGLTANRVNAVYPVTLEICKALTKYIKEQNKMRTKDGFDGKKLCLQYTTEVVTDCVLGVSAQSFSDNPTPIVEMISRVFEQSNFFILFTLVSGLFPFARKLFTVRFFAKDVEDFFFNLMQTSIDLRRKNKNPERVDFLNYMLYLQDKKNLKLEELASHTMSFLTDGFETTAMVLTNTLLLLARNPETQEKLRAEIGDEPLSFDKLNELPYLDACIHETIRIFPPLLFARKICTEPAEFVNKDGVSVQLKPDDVVVVPAYSLQMDPEIYDDPETFQPDRFSEENGGVRKYREMGAYFGFGDGPRVCLGMRFALTQTKAAIVEVVRNFNIKCNPKTRKDNLLNATYFMAALEGGVWLDFEERN